MTAKYIDLKEELAHSVVVGAGITAIRNILAWLDDHPDQVPGRTITESELKGVNEWLPDTAQIGPIERRDVAEFFGITVVPDPEPTNAEKLRDAITNAARGVGIGSTTANIKAIAEHLDAAGVKAPGGDDD